MIDKTLSAEDRYQTDPEFHRLVQSLYHLIEDARYTPTELRDALILAATKYEMTHLRMSHMMDEINLHLLNPNA